jgi:hypothetical protein
LTAEKMGRRKGEMEDWDRRRLFGLFAWVGGWGKRGV